MILSLGMLLIAACQLSAQRRTISVDGQVRDKTRVAVSDARITFQLPGANSRTVRTNKAGSYAFSNLTPGLYSVRIEARGFQTYEARDIRVSGSQTLHLSFTLELPRVKQQVVVASGDKPLTIEPESSPSTILLSGSAMTGLPDDPNDFAAAVQALAGPSALGAFGLQVFVNGFVDGQMPPKETIAQIRINDNPFSAENDRPGTDRIDAITKGGGRQLHGETYVNLDVGRWDARNPFTRPLPPDPSGLYGGNIGGPLTSRASFFISLERAQTDFRNAIQATVLDAALSPELINNNPADFEKSLLLNPRLDITLNQKNTLTTNYSSSQYVLPHEGVGGTSLTESGYRVSSRQQTAQISETAVLSPKVINETKSQFIAMDLIQSPYMISPGISVDQAFTTSNPSSALSSLRDNSWEFQDNVSAVVGPHAIRTGIRLRGDLSHETRQENSSGTYSFSAGSGPELGPDNVPVSNSEGQAVIVALSALERYRRTILFQNESLSLAGIRLLGGGATSYSMDAGNPLANVRQYDVGVYMQDDWHIKPNFLLGAGLRYEAQTHLSDPLDFGPRLSFAWSPAKSSNGSAHTVVRGGFGVFYQRLDDKLVLQANHSATPHLKYVTSDPAILDYFPVMPSSSRLAPFATAADSFELGPDLRAPATLQLTFGIEQELPFKTRLSAAVTGARTSRDLLIEDTSTIQLGAPRSLILQSAGQLTQRQLKVDLSNQLSKRVKLTADYVLNKARSNTDGTTAPAAEPVNLLDEFGRSAMDIRNNFTLTGSINAPWGLTFSPFVVASSNRPFNIIAGTLQDVDIPITGRPALATNRNQPGVVLTAFGVFLLQPLPGEPTIPRNLGVGPAFFSASARLSKTFKLGELSSSSQSGADAASDEKHRYALVISAQIINMTNHLNPGILEGNLTSPLFGTASSLAPGFNFGGGTAPILKQPQINRRIEAQIRFTF